jgi:hypothetical protein
MDAHDRLIRQIVAALESHLAEGQPLRIPEAGNLLWTWFLALHETRTYGDAGPHAITFAEIDAYAALMRWELEPRHVSALRMIDAAWLKHARESTGEDAGQPARAPAMTAALFDAVFVS